LLTDTFPPRGMARDGRWMPLPPFFPSRSDLLFFFPGWKRGLPSSLLPFFSRRWRGEMVKAFALGTFFFLFSPGESDPSSSLLFPDIIDESSLFLSEGKNFPLFLPFFFLFGGRPLFLPPNEEKKRPFFPPPPPRGVWPSPFFFLWKEVWKGPPPLLFLV